MELLDTDDAKSSLLKKSAQFKKGLENEVQLLTDNTQKIVTNALIIGGTLAVTYIIVRQFSKRKKSKGKSKTKKIKFVQDSNARLQNASYDDDDSEPGIVSQIGSALAAQATVFLLNLAKEKLSGYLQSHFAKEAETSNERS
jgi:hypothetical protein